MFSLSNQIKAPDDEEEDQDCDNSLVKQTFLTYNYNHHFEQTHDFSPNSWIPHNQKKSPVFESDSNPTKFDFDFAKSKSRKRKTGVFDFETLAAAAAGKTGDFEGGGGGRVVQSTGRKDRHSKVRTARGPRDRRVRLSPRTAIQFYDVQDRLGYDRPSKAIDWLIKEAKSAIDALNERSTGAENDGGFLIERKNDAVSGFGFCVDGAPPPAAEFQGFNSDLQHYQQGFCSAFSETNWEFGKLQKMLNWNSGNENSGNNAAALYSPAAAISGHGGGGYVFSQREPLQSSFVNYSPISNADFPAFNFCNELLNVTASATLMKENETEKINSEIDY